VSGLAGLLGPAALKRLGLALRATLFHPSAASLRSFAAALPPAGPKKAAAALVLMTKLNILEKKTYFINSLW